jgi:hypothetical protein
VELIIPALAAALSLLTPASGSAQYNGAISSFDPDLTGEHTTERSVFLDPPHVYAVGVYGSWIGTAAPTGHLTAGAGSSESSKAGPAYTKAPYGSHAEAPTLTFLRVLASSASPVLLPIRWNAVIHAGIYDFGHHTLDRRSDGDDRGDLTVDAIRGAEAPGSDVDQARIFSEERGIRFVLLPEPRVVRSTLMILPILASHRTPQPALRGRGKVRSRLGCGSQGGGHLRFRSCQIPRCSGIARLASACVYHRLSATALSRDSPRGIVLQAIFSTARISWVAPQAYSTPRPV